MATIVDKSACEAAGQGLEAGLLPISPFTALQFHFGMLLGVDDLETGQAYPRGKQRLHNAWLHREGVVWGFNVAFNDKSKELTVAPGLALDAAGHELHLDRLACMDLGLWYAAHKDDSAFAKAFKHLEDGGIQFSAHVVAKFKACLTRPVPALLEPCAGTQTDTAYSRVFETVELLLRPGPAPKKDPGYHRLRILFQLAPDGANYADVKTRREAIQAKPLTDQPAAYLAALREFAALDVIDLQPQQATETQAASIFPEDPTEVVLAELADILVKPSPAGGFALAEPLPKPVVTVRPSHIATATLQELLCGPLFAVPAPIQPLAAKKTGPTVTAASLTEKPKTIKLTVSRPIALKTLVPQAFLVSDYSDASGWKPLCVKGITAKDDSTILIDLSDAPQGTHLRLVIRGTGATPLLAKDNLLPLGAPGAGGPDDGVDYVKMFKRT